MPKFLHENQHAKNPSMLIRTHEFWCNLMGENLMNLIEKFLILLVVLKFQQALNYNQNIKLSDGKKVFIV